MKTIRILLAALLFSPLFSFAQTAEELIEKYIEATNAEDIEEVQSFKYNRSYVANANTDYDEEVVIVRDKELYSQKKTLLKRDFFYVLNGNKGWVKIPMGSLDKKQSYSTKDLNAKEVDELSTQVKDGILPFVNFEEKGYKMSSPVTTATVSGKRTSKLALEKTGIKRAYYFDNTTGLVVREEWTENGITHTMDHVKYEETEIGVKLPVSSTYIDTRGKRQNKVSTEWSFKDPEKGVTFTK